METQKIQEKIEQIEQEIQKLPYHKATEHHIGKLKAKLAKLRAELIEKSVKKGGGGAGYAVRKQGDATIVLVGFPSVGKSTLLNKLTKADSKVAAYDFTTLKVIPGIMEYKGAKIQVLDVPGLIKGAAMGKGRGKEVLSVARAADLLLLMASIENPETFTIMEQELYLAGVRMDQKEPDVVITKRLRGGIEISGNIKSISKPTIKSLAQEFSILNAKISFNQDVSQEELIDVLMGNRIYVPTLKILSKIDILPKIKADKILQKLEKDCIFISSEENIGIQQLKQEILKKLNLIRIYLKKTLKARPEKKPLICKKGVTVLQAAQEISEELAAQIKGARIKGASAAFENQFVGKTHLLVDKDQVFFVKE